MVSPPVILLLPMGAEYENDRDINCNLPLVEFRAPRTCAGRTLGAERTCFYLPGYPQLGGHVVWPVRCMETACVRNAA